MDKKKINKSQVSDELQKNYLKVMNHLGQYAETTKQAIKHKNNENALSFIKSGIDQNNIIEDFLVTAILYQNVEIFKALLEKNQINFKELIKVNSSVIRSDLRFNTELKKEISENYNDVEIPYLILAAAGGDLTIFQSILSKGGDALLTGHVALSRKKKNSFNSNILGAAAYFGNHELIKFIFEKNINVDINFKATERNSKVKVSAFSKEFTGYTPILLAVASESNEGDTLKTVKLLASHPKIELFSTDFEKNNLLHLAAKYGKLETVKYLINELKFSIEDCNSEGLTAISTAQGEEIVNYLKSFDKSAFVIDKELLELLDSDEKEKKPNKKKKKQKEKFGLGTTEYESQPQENPKKEIIKEKKEEVEQKNKSETKISEEKTQVVQETNKVNNPKVLAINKEELEKFKLQEKEKKEKIEKDLKIQEQARLLELENEKNKKRGVKQPNEKENKNKKIEEVQTSENIAPKEQILVETTSTVNNQTTLENIPQKIEEIVTIEKKEVVDIPHIEEKIETPKITEQPKPNEKSVSKEQQKELNDLRENFEKLQRSSTQDKQRIQELENLLNSQFRNTRNQNEIQSSEENINDVILLANNELKEQSAIISALQNQVDIYELRNIENLNLEELEYLKKFFIEKIEKINESISRKNGFSA